MNKNLKIFTNNIADTATNQIDILLNQESFKDAKVRIMPDVHAGKGCVIGFTANLGDKIIPNIVGVDIGCGMLCISLGNIDLDLAYLDNVIRENIPSGFDIHNNKQFSFEELKDMFCYKELRNLDKFERGIGTLGGGNHFIEIDVDSENNKYLVIHTGSRNVGNQVAIYYQNQAIHTCQNGKYIPEELCYLEGKDAANYLHDMKICQKYATLNRETIAQLIIKNYFGLSWNDICFVNHNCNKVLQADFKYYNTFETIHNYIDDKNIVRKGAIRTNKDEIVLITINMKDGSIIAKGKGNEDWNNSAPHGAGRLMGRGEAKKTFTLEEFEESMKGIFSTSIRQSTLDEAPMVYKPIDEILENIKDTVDVIEVIKPIYNFKAN